MRKKLKTKHSKKSKLISRKEAIKMDMDIKKDVELYFKYDGIIYLCASCLIGLVLLGAIIDHAFRKKCSLGNKWIYSQWKCVKYEGNCNPEQNVFTQYIYNNELNKCVGRCDPKKRHDFDYKYYWNNGECKPLPPNSIWRNKNRFGKEEKALQEEFLKSKNEN